MKKLLAVLLLLCAGLASAQETYSVNMSSAANVAKLDLGRVQNNEAVCSRLNLALSCTQAQACVAANVVGGASCSGSDAVAAGVRIYANTLAGREGFLTNELVKPPLLIFVQKQAEKAMATLRLACLAAPNQTAKDAFCTGIGQSAGCGICEAFQ